MELFASLPASQDNAASSQGILLRMFKQEPTDQTASPGGSSYVVHVGSETERSPCSRTPPRHATATRSRSRSPLITSSRACSTSLGVSALDHSAQPSVCNSLDVCQSSKLVLPSEGVSGDISAAVTSSTATTATTTRFTSTQSSETFKLSVIRSDDGLYVCNYPGCGRLCRRQGDILRHQQSHLIHRIRYPCNQPGCGGVTTVASGVAVTTAVPSCGHAQSVGSPVQYVTRCDFPGCGRQFTRHGSLKSHFRIHWKLLSLLNVTSDNGESSR